MPAFRTAPHAVPRAIVLGIFGLLLLGWLGFQPPTVNAQDVVATPVASPASDPASTGQGPAEQALAEKFAPIMNIKVQPSDCDPEGEAYLPVAVEATLGDPQVKLMQRTMVDGKTIDTEIMVGPTAADLYGLDETYYLSLPGNSLEPGCDYETWSRQRYAELGIEPSIYARVAAEDGTSGKLVVQYWFYWVFDNFNNTHESDWEMIQLVFDADTAQQVLDQDLTPSAVIFAQHGGGETADWDDHKVERDGNHINVFSAAGSHASYYGSAVWVGWGAHGSGFGCDMVNPDVRQVPTSVILLPAWIDDLEAEDEFAWLAFGGRWGKRQAWQFDAPPGPAMGEKWYLPVSWAEGLRSYSLAVPHNETIGPGPSGIFCGLTELGGLAAANFPVHPSVIIGATAVAIGALLWFAFWSRHQLRRAISIFVRHLRAFLPVSLWLLVVAIIANWVDSEWDTWLGIEPHQNLGMLGGLSAFGIGSLQHFALTLFVAPIIMVLTAKFVHDGQHSFTGAWRETLPRWWVLLRVNLLNALLVTLMSITIILLPLAIYKNVQWFWSSQSAILNDARVLDARHESRRLTRHHWWSTLRMAILVMIISGIPGPIIGMIFFVTSLVSIQTAGLISGLVYAICYPIAIIAATLYYLELRDEKLAEGTLLTDASHEPRFWRPSWRKRTTAEPGSVPAT